MAADVCIIVTFYELNLIPPIKVRIQENGIVCVKNQLCVMHIDFIVMKDIYDVHKMIV